MFRYYTTQRPPSLGAIPKGAVNVNDFGCKKEVEGDIEAYGWVEYNDKPSNAKDYELLFEAELEANRQFETIEEIKKKLKASNHNNIEMSFDNQGNAHIKANNEKGRTIKATVFKDGSKEIKLEG